MGQTVLTVDRFFDGAFDPGKNIYVGDVLPEARHRAWISCDWGFEHDSATYWHFLDDFGVVRTYHEMLVRHLGARELAERIAQEARLDLDGAPMRFETFLLSPDAFNQPGSDSASVAMHMDAVFEERGLPRPVSFSKNRSKRDLAMSGALRSPCAWQISARCSALIRCLLTALRDPMRPDMVAVFEGDDPLAAAGAAIQYAEGDGKWLRRYWY